MRRKVRKITQTEFVRDVKTTIAKEKWTRVKDPSGLEELGIDPHTIKRPRGRPQKQPLSNEQWVQLVFKQQLQAGKPFSNAMGADLNPCFYGVADAQGVNVSKVREAWAAVPPEKRKRIKETLKSLLLEHGELHPRHRK